MEPGMITDMPRHETPEQAEIRARLREIGERLSALEAERTQAVQDEVDTARLALAIGIRQADIARDLGRSREHIRNITAPPKGEQ